LPGGGGIVNIGHVTKVQLDQLSSIHISVLQLASKFLDIYLSISMGLEVLHCNHVPIGTWF
jgi:hypothetical protein